MDKDLNFKKFKKVHSDENMAILKHPKGHEIHVAKKHLSPKMRGEIEALPHLSEGGEIEDNPIKPASKMEQFQQSYRNAIEHKKVEEHAPRMAHGGAIYMPDGGIVPTEDEIKAAAIKAGMPGASMNPLESLGANKPFAEAEFIKQGLEKKEADKQWAEHDAQKAQAQKEAEQLKIDEANKYRVQGGLAPIPDIINKQEMPQSSITQAAYTPAVASAGPQQTADPYGMVAYNQAMQTGMQGMQQGLQEQQKADLALAHEQQQTIQKQQAQQQQLINDFQAKHQELNDEMQHAYEDMKAGHIDPNAYWGDMSAPGKFATIIGLIGGGIAAGLTGKDNPAITAMNNQIERNVKAQQLNMGNKMNVFNAMKQKYGSEIDAQNALRLMYATSMDNELKLAAAKSADPAARARYMQASAQLGMQYAPVAQQMAMKQAALQGASTGKLDPSMQVRFLVPEHHQGKAYEEIAEADKLGKIRDRMMTGFDRLAEINTAGYRLKHPIDSKKEIDSIISSIVPNLSKETAGRYTEEDAKTIGKILNTLGSGKQTIAAQRSALLKLANERMNFPITKSYGINLGQSGQFNDQGQSKFKSYAPVKGTK